MKYAMLIYMPAQPTDLGSDEDPAAVTKEYWALRDDPGCIGGEHLSSADTATTVRLSDGQTLLTDGPFAATKEVLTGFFLYEADNVDVALEFAGRIPATRFGGSIEVRPMMMEHPS